MRFTCEKVRVDLTYLLAFHLHRATEQKRLQRTEKIKRQNIHLQSTYYSSLIPASSCKVMVTTQAVSLAALVNLQITVIVANLKNADVRGQLA